MYERERERERERAPGNMALIGPSKGKLVGKCADLTKLIILLQLLRAQERRTGQLTVLLSIGAVTDLNLSVLRN